MMMSWAETGDTAHLQRCKRVMQRGRVAERLHRREVAMESYQWVADMWQHADPELRPVVDEARAALERLTAEGH